MTAKSVSQRDDARQIFAGRIDVLYTMGRHYLSLPFAVLCVPATVLAGNKLGFLPVTPLLLQMAVVIAAEQLTAAYRNRPPGSDPHFWARRYTFVSAIAGATWGLGSMFWFAWGSFPAQAYLALAYLGMTATEFIARSSYRPAYIVHTGFALGPLVVLLLIQGGLFPTMTAVLVAFFGAVLISYSGGMGRLIDEGLSLRNENAELVVHLQSEKAEAILARDSAQASAMAKSAFIANISHELRTPMNALLGMAQLLERAELPKQQADHVKVMLEAGRGLQTLLDDVIALTRDDDDALEDEDCDPVQTARAVTRLLQPRAWEKRLRLTLTAASDLPRVAADPRRVRQALLKLADNALKFTERGLVDIRLDLDRDAPESRWCASPFPIPVRASGRMWRRACSSLSRPAMSPTPARNRARAWAWRSPNASSSRRAAKSVSKSTPGDGALFWFTLAGLGPGGHCRDAESARRNARRGAAWLVGFDLRSGARRRDVACQSAGAVRQQGRDRRQCRRGGGARQPRTFRRPDRRLRRSRSAGRRARRQGAHRGRAAARRPRAQRHRLRVALAGDQRSPVPGAGFRSVPGATKTMPTSRLPAAIDAVAFSNLEKSVGLKTLIEILQCYVATAEQLTNALAEACRRGEMGAMRHGWPRISWAPRADSA